MDLSELITVQWPAAFLGGYASGLLAMSTIDWVRELIAHVR